jgi:hypothetical protein
MGLVPSADSKAANNWPLRRRWAKSRPWTNASFLSLFLGSGASEWLPQTRQPADNLSG